MAGAVVSRPGYPSAGQLDSFLTAYHVPRRQPAASDVGPGVRGADTAVLYTTLDGSPRARATTPATKHRCTMTTQTASATHSNANHPQGGSGMTFLGWTVGALAGIAAYLWPGTPGSSSLEGVALPPQTVVSPTP